MINLFTNFYNEPNTKRKKELDLCMQKNINNSFINFIPIESNERMKYSNFFEIINQYTAPNDINIISNLDIYFDESVNILNEMGKEEALILCRWESMADGSLKFAERPDSQDAWVFRGKIQNVYGDFNLGYCGCDNRIAHEISKAGYKVSNPARTVKIIHVHSSNIRNYKPKGKERKNFEVSGPYLTIYPTTWLNRK